MVLTMQVIGNIGKDAVINVVGDKRVANFSVAHTERWKDNKGQQMERTTWVECALWGNENVFPFLKSGTLVAVDGTPEARAYTTKVGNELRASLTCKAFGLKLLSATKKDGENGTGGKATSSGAAKAVVKENGQPVYNTEIIDDNEPPAFTNTHADGTAHDLPF